MKLLVSLSSHLTTHHNQKKRLIALINKGMIKDICVKVMIKIQFWSTITLPHLSFDRPRAKLKKKNIN